MKPSELLLAISVSLTFSQWVQANPTGAQVVQGTASFSNPSANVLNINNSHNAIINWQKFNIGPGQTTNFIQPSAASSVLNRVLSNAPSQIMGNLNSNGQVFLLNQHGILIGQGAQINTAGFFGSTLNITDADFLNGKLKFEGGGLGGIENQGYIHAGDNGNIVLIAPEIENGGVIQVEDGNIILAAGKSITITSLTNAAIQFEIQGQEDSVTNLGQIIADQGAVSLFAGTLKHSGSIRATGLVQDADGTIRLVGTHENTITGRMDVSGKQGGRIEILGDEVTLKSGSVIDASGEQGGGDILIGGDLQGLNPAIQNAMSTTIEQGAVISADAQDDGNGGKVIVFAENDVHVHGSVTARGGANGGDGGFIETSGLQLLDITAVPDASAMNGESGEWLIDPNNITITDIGPFASIIGDPDFTSIDDSAVLDVSLIIAAMNLGNNVSVTTGSAGSNSEAGDINIDADISVSASIPGNLSLSAHNDINVNANITSSLGSFNLDLTADSDVSGAGSVNFNSGIIRTFGDISVAANEIHVAGNFLFDSISNMGLAAPFIVDPGATLTLNNFVNLSGSDITIDGTLLAQGACFGDGCVSFSITANQVTNNGEISVDQSYLNIESNLINNALLSFPTGDPIDTPGIFVGSSSPQSLSFNPGSTISSFGDTRIEVFGSIILNNVQLDVLSQLNWQGISSTDQVLLNNSVLSIFDEFAILFGTDPLAAINQVGTSSIVVMPDAYFSQFSTGNTNINVDFFSKGQVEIFDTLGGLTFSNAQVIEDGGRLYGNGTFNAPSFTFASGGGVEPGWDFGTGTLTINSTSGVTFQPGSFGIFEINNTNTYDQLVVNDDVTINGGNLFVLWDGYSGTPVSPSDTFDFITANAINAAFTTTYDPLTITSFPDNIVTGNTYQYTIDSIDSVTPVVYWDGGAFTQNWDDQDNWSGDLVPANGELVIIEQDVDLSSTTNVLGGLQISGDFQLNANANLVMNGDIFSHSDTDLFDNAVISGTGTWFNLAYAAIIDPSITAPVSITAVENYGAFQFAQLTPSAFSIDIASDFNNWGNHLIYTVPATSASINYSGVSGLFNLGFMGISTVPDLQFSGFITNSNTSEMYVQQGNIEFNSVTTLGGSIKTADTTLVSLNAGNHTILDGLIFQTIAGTSGNLSIASGVLGIEGGLSLDTLNINNAIVDVNTLGTNASDNILKAGIINWNGNSIISGDVSGSPTGVLEIRPTDVLNVSGGALHSFIGLNIIHDGEIFIASPTDRLVLLGSQLTTGSTGTITGLGTLDLQVGSDWLLTTANQLLPVAMTLDLNGGNLINVENLVFPGTVNVLEASFVENGPIVIPSTTTFNYFDTEDIAPLFDVINNGVFRVLSGSEVNLSALNDAVFINNGTLEVGLNTTLNVLTELRNNGVLIGNVSGATTNNDLFEPVSSQLELLFESEYLDYVDFVNTMSFLIDYAELIVSSADKNGEERAPRLVCN